MFLLNNVSAHKLQIKTKGKQKNKSFNLLLKPQEKKEKSFNNLMIYCKVCGQNEKFTKLHTIFDGKRVIAYGIVRFSA